MPALFVLLVLQDSAALIERLRDGDIGVREKAFAELEKLGAAAEPALKKAASDPDATVALHVGRLLRILELDRVLSPALKREFPGICRRLGKGPGDEWTRLYLQVSTAQPDAEGRIPHAHLTREDLEPLALNAVRHALTSEDRQRSCSAADAWRHLSALPAMIGWLRDPQNNHRDSTRQSIVSLLGRDAVALYLKEFANDPRLLVESLEDCDEFIPHEAVPALAPLVAHSDAEVRAYSIRLLSRVGIPVQAKDALKLLAGPEEESKLQGLRFLAALGGPEHVAAATALLADPTANVRCEAIRTLRSLKTELPADSLKALLADDDVDVRQAAMTAPRRKFEPELLPLLRANLLHEKDQVQRAALRVLNRIKDPELAERIETVLHGPSSWQKVEFMSALMDISREKAAGPIRKILDSPAEESYARRKAIDYLADLKADPPPEVLKGLTSDAQKELAAAAALRLARTAPDLLRPELPRLLQDPDIRRYLKVTELAERVRPSDLVPELMKAFQAEDRGRSELETSLAILGGTEIAPQMRAFLKEEDPALRMAAVRVLGRLKDAESRPALLAMLEDEEEHAQYWVLNSLEQIGRGADWAPFAKLADHEDEEVKFAAVRILWASPAKEMIPTFRKLLGRQEQGIVEMAAAALWELGDREVVGTMVDRVGATDLRNTSMASEFVAVVSPERLRDRVASLLEAREGYPRSVGIWLMEVLGMKSEARRLQPLLADAWTSKEAADAIVSLEARELIPDLKARLKSPHVREREAALSALTGLGGSDAGPAIRELLGDRDYDLRLKAIASLGRLKDRESVPALLEFLKDQNPHFRKAAVEALTRIGDPAAGPALLPLMAARDGSLRADVVEALAELRIKEAAPELKRRLADFDDHYTILTALGNLDAREIIPDLLRYFQEDKCDNCIPRTLVKLQAAEGRSPIRRKLEEMKAAGESDGSLAWRLAQLGDSSFLVELLDHKDAQIRKEAATNLCELGDRRGVPEALKQADDRFRSITVLNAVRNPEGWNKLKGFRFPTARNGIRRRLIERFGSQAGMPIRLQGLEGFDRTAWSIESIRVERRSSDAGDVLMGLLNDARADVCSSARRSSNEWSWILDAGSIRILPRDDAVKFWTQWWADEQAKKK